jgi:hypothetical protein
MLPVSIDSSRVEVLWNEQLRDDVQVRILLGLRERFFSDVTVARNYRAFAGSLLVCNLPLLPPSLPDESNVGGIVAEGETSKTSCRY